jgi:hypothetical protein
MYSGRKNRDPNAPWMPRKFQAAILSLQDIDAVDGASARPGFVRNTPQSA